MSIHVPTKTNEVNGGVQKLYDFANGYGASVVKHQFSYGGKDGKWEVAVLGKNGGLDYSTPITDDVLGYLEWSEVERVLDDIERLPAGKTV